MSLASLLPAPVRRFNENHSSNVALWVGVGFFALYIVAATMGQKQIMAMMALGLLCCMGAACLRLTLLCCVLWLLLAGTTPEMWLPGFIPNSSNVATTVVKVAGIGLAVICALRYGLVFDLFNPGFAFMLLFFEGLVHGLWPTLTVSDSLRTVVGCASPYAFAFSRLPRRWTAGIIEATIWVPLLILVFGVFLAAVGAKPFFSPDAGGSVRVAGSSHPAFLATLAMTSVYACMIELYRNGRPRYLWLFAMNFLILIGSGSRSPLGCAVMVTAIAFIAIRSESFTLRKRVLPLLIGLFALPVMLVLAATSKSLRLLTVISGNAQGLSGRDLIWPFFQAAWSQSPMFGWGIGTGKLLIDPDSPTAKLLGTTAAHNEYLQIGVEGGYVGIAIVMSFLALWTWRRSRVLFRTDKIITRLIMVGFAVESITDNTLISAPTTVLFVWLTAVFARGNVERQEARATAGGGTSPVLQTPANAVA